MTFGSFSTDQYGQRLGKEIGAVFNVTTTTQSFPVVLTPPSQHHVLWKVSGRPPSLRSNMVLTIRDSQTSRDAFQAQGACQRGCMHMEVVTAGRIKKTPLDTRSYLNMCVISDHARKYRMHMWRVSIDPKLDSGM